MKVFAQILGTGTVDSSPSVLFFLDNRRYLINAGEGLQRYCLEHKVKLSRINDIYFTSLSPEHAGGVPGLTLTLNDMTNARLNFYGPPNLAHYLFSTRIFIHRNALSMHIDQFEPLPANFSEEIKELPSAAPAESPSAAPRAEVKPAIQIFADDKSKRNANDNNQNGNANKNNNGKSKNNNNNGKKNGNNVPNGPGRPDSIKLAEPTLRVVPVVLQRSSEQLKKAEASASAEVEQPVSQKEDSLSSKRPRTEQSLSSSSSPAQSSSPSVPSAAPGPFGTPSLRFPHCLTRSIDMREVFQMKPASPPPPSEGKKRDNDCSHSTHANSHQKNPLPLPEKTCTHVISYICSAPDTPGKFDTAKAKALGIPFGPLCGRLTRGETVFLPDGRMIQPEDVVAPAILGPISVVICCPSLDYLSSLTSHSAWKSHQIPEAAASSSASATAAPASPVSCMIHMTPLSIIQTAEYAAFMCSFGDNCQHILVDASVCRQRAIFMSSATALSKLNVIDPHMFEMPFTNNDEASIEALFPKSSGRVYPPKMLVGDSGMRFNMIPYAQLGLQMTHLLPTLDLNQTQQDLFRPMIPAPPSASNGMDEMDDVPPEEEEAPKKGAAAPKKKSKEQEAAAAAAAAAASTEPVIAMIPNPIDVYELRRSIAEYRKHCVIDLLYPSAQKAFLERLALPTIPDVSASGALICEEADKIMASLPSLPASSSLPPHTCKSSSSSSSSPAKLEQPKEEELLAAATVTAADDVDEFPEEDQMDESVILSPSKASASASSSAPVVCDAHHLEVLQSIGSESAELVFLGTGSAIPSKYRNVSSIYLHMFDKGGMLLDAGEGTLGQLRRKYGDKYKEVLINIKCTWISHMHADHHCGLPAVIHARQQVLVEVGRAEDEQPMVVVGPSALNRYLKEYSACVAPLSFVFYDNADTMSLEKMPLNLSRFLASTFGISQLQSVRVIHCYDAYALVLKNHKGWKLVYSGDTRPCTRVVQAGKDATVLIHEATFEDGMMDEAVAKKHSTTTEAIDVGSQMGAYRIVLTHFSQRYPKIPQFDDIQCQRTGIAFDLMSINFAHLSVLPKMITPLKQVFSEEVEEMME